MSGKCVVDVEKQWLERNRHYSELDETKLTSIFYFTLIWNLFEKELCGNDAAIRTHPEMVAEKHSDALADKLVEEVYLHFLDRYVENGQITPLFNGFKFGRDAQDGQRYKGFVSETLLSVGVCRIKQVQALLYIAFRLRNNLYHGIKDVSELYEQNENFSQINRLLMALVDCKKDDNPC